MEQPQHRFSQATSGQLPARQIHAHKPTRRMSPSATEKQQQPGRPTPAVVSRARLSRSAFSKSPAPYPGKREPQLKDQEVWNSTEDLFWDHMREVQNKWNTLKLNDDIWAKLIYFEQNRRLAKAYVSTPVLTIDGSTNGLDGFRIGLSGIENSYRDLDSVACLRSIGYGIKLKIDQHGNILIRKVTPQLATGSANGAVAPSACSIWVKEWPSAGRHSANSHSLTSSSSSSASSSSSSNSDYSHLAPLDQWPMREITDTELSYKLFDMQKFRLQLERQTGCAGKTSGETLVDWRQCVSIISFVRQTPVKQVNGRAKLFGPLQHKQPLLSDPCWIMLINIIAIDMLKSSICDENYASPKPINQMSSMIDNYQHQARQAARVRRKLPDSMMTGATIDENMPLDSPEGPEARSKPADRLYRKQQQQQQQVQDDGQTASSNSARLRRISNSGQLAYSSSNLKGSANPLRPVIQPKGGLTGSNFSQQLAGAGSIYCAASSGSVSSFSNNAIYTTFTGKYLDKHQRNRVPRKKSADDLASRQQSQLGSLYFIDSMLGGSSHRLAQLNASTRLRSPSPMLEPVNQQIGGTRIPFARKPMSGRAQQKHLSHSLSAFDLSHGLKLNLSSLKAIKMNFDSDKEAEDDKVQLQQANKENQRDKKSGKIQRSERVISAFNNEASEWANLAKRYSKLNASKSTNELNSNGGQHVADDEGIKNSSSSHLLAEGEDGDKKHKEIINMTTKQNASAASSSSGCADHDYLVSHSSSSMTSSTRTSSGAIDEGVVSQPTSSSGIAGSGNTSDEYEKETRLATETQSRMQSDKQIKGISKRGTVKDSCPGENLEPSDERPPSSKSMQQLQRRQQKAAISQNRRFKTKLVVDENIDHLNCEAQSCHHLEDLLVDEQHCDCISDEHLGHLDRPCDTCDCCCDCFYKPDDHDNQGLPLSTHHCDLPEDVCDCGALQELPEDPIYDHLPRFGRSVGRSDKSKGRRKSSKNSSCNDLTTIYDHDDIEPAPMPDDPKGKIKRAPSKELKRSNGWLEKRKYIRLFPKFMFSSSSSSADPASCSPDSPTNKLAKSNTIERGGYASEKFQRSRSSQNLVRRNY